MIYEKITISLSLVFLKDKRLITSALSRWDPLAGNTGTEAVEDEISAEALLGKLLRPSTTVERDLITNLFVKVGFFVKERRMT